MLISFARQNAGHWRLIKRHLRLQNLSHFASCSTSYQIVNSIRQFIHILKGTAVISLLQSAPETYDLFDDIILSSDGKIVYQGHREKVLEFFEFMGFKCPERKGVADFLQEVLPNSTEPLGVTVLKTHGLTPDAYWYWLGIGALLSPIGRPQAILSEETLAERSSSEKGNDIGRNITSGLTTNGSIDLTSKKKHGMIIPFQPLSICFNDTKYAVDVSQELKAQGFLEDRLEILKGVSGTFRPGVLTALMGVSGAEKTTLMDVLAGRKTCGYTEANYISTMRRNRLSIKCITNSKSKERTRPKLGQNITLLHCM